MLYVIYIVQVLLVPIFYYIIDIVYNTLVKKYQTNKCFVEPFKNDGYEPNSFNVTCKNTCVDPVNLITTTQLDELTLRKYMKSRYLRGYISEYQRLSDEFMDEFINELPIHLISRHQILSESFIRKHYDVLEMSTVSEYQELSNEFLDEFEAYIEFSFITREKNTEEGYPCDTHCYLLEHPNFYTSNMECKQCKKEYLDSYEY